MVKAKFVLDAMYQLTDDDIILELKDRPLLTERLRSILACIEDASSKLPR